MDTMRKYIFIYRYVTLKSVTSPKAACFNKEKLYTYTYLSINLHILLIITCTILWSISLSENIIRNKVLHCRQSTPQIASAKIRDRKVVIFLLKAIRPGSYTIEYREEAILVPSILFICSFGIFEPNNVKDVLCILHILCQLGIINSFKDLRITVAHIFWHLWESVPFPLSKESNLNLSLFHR